MLLQRCDAKFRDLPGSLYDVSVTTTNLPDDGARDTAPAPSAESQPSPATRESRRGLLGRAALAMTAGLLGAGAGAGAAHWRDTHLSPTARTAPRPASPGSALGTRVVFQTDGESGKLALTFDDGPDPRWTPLVLDMLARLHVRATFFVLGSAAEAHPELIAREVAEGHEVAVHNWVHTDVYGVGFSELSDSVDRTRQAIMAAGAPSPRLWRPPYGRVDAPAMMVASQKRMDLLLWSVHTPSTAAATAVKDVAGAGSVVLCHDGRAQPSQALFAALEGALRSLLERGLTVTTGSDLLASARWAEGQSPA